MSKQTYTLDEAIELANTGVKMTHDNYSSNEYFTAESNIMILKDGVECSKEEYLYHRKDWGNDGYYIFEELSIDNIPQSEPQPDKSEPKVIKTRTYSITEETFDNGTIMQHRTNDGFNAYDLLGMLEHTQLDIITQIKNKLPKADIVKRTVVVDELPKE